MKVPHHHPLDSRLYYPGLSFTGTATHHGSLGLIETFLMAVLLARLLTLGFCDAALPARLLALGFDSVLLPARSFALSIPHGSFTVAAAHLSLSSHIMILSYYHIYIIILIYYHII